MCDVKNENMVRIVVLDITKPFATAVYDEAILPVLKATEFIEKYINMAKYRIVTI